MKHAGALHDAREAPRPLQHFQDSFARALCGTDTEADASSECDSLVRQPGFAVYRNTVMKGCIDALQANYACVARLVGDEWFRAAAAIYVRAHPPEQPTLLRYGRDFEEFLAAFEAADELPYLPGVARLDRFWVEAHTAGDEASVDPHALAALDARTIMRVRLRPHTSARWCWFDTHPIYTIWQRNRASGPIDESHIAWHGEGALVVRARDEVRWIELGAAAHAFVQACADGCTLADAAAAALAIDAAVDPASVMRPLLDIGALVAADASLATGGRA